MDASFYEGGPDAEAPCDCPVCNPEAAEGAYLRAVLRACSIPPAPPHLRARIVSQVRIIARLSQADQPPSL